MQIEQTQDYNLFKRLPGNRQLSPGHLGRLRESIEKENLSQYQPILVNENWEVIDGQNRLEVLKSLELPVYYMQAPGLRLPEVQTLNTLNKVWTPIDYAKSYIELGRPAYQFYMELKNQYHAPHNVLLTYIYFGSGKAMNQEFKRGELVVSDPEATKKYLDQLSDVGVYYSKYTKAAFAIALLKIMCHPDYDHKRMVAKMEQQGHNIPDLATVEEYQRALEKTFNYHMSNNRVRFF